MVINYNIDLLKFICERDNCIIQFEDYSKLNKTIRIKFICGTNECKEIGEKTFERIFKSNGICRICTNKISLIKRQNTCVEKFGTENAYQSEEIKDKIKKKHLDKLGVENPMKSKEIVTKVQNTVMNKYGVQNIMQLEEIKDKAKETSFKHFGVFYPSQSEEIKNKKIETTLNNFGVKCSLQ
jgi:hypothetical protein